ncbi:MAG: ABC transporter ATP-binding protein [Chloroflexi bacterium]|nr:ABC transporter ATP-binding protein [Chloroflexota bacterium]
MEVVIVVESLVKRFGDVVALRGVSFEVFRGEVFGILGPNGAGKTTTLECIEGIQTPTAGRALLLGVDTHRDAGKVKERIGVQLQASAYFDYLTLTEILELFGRFYPRRASPKELLATVGLAEKANTPVRKLSGGQKQRFTIAATLVNDPEVVFLDEPTTGLDPQARRNLWGLIQQIHRDGRTVVLTTHYMEEAQALCQRVAIMDLGAIAALDTPVNLIQGLPTPYEVRVQSSVLLPLEEIQRLSYVQAVSREDNGYSLKVSEASRAVPVLLDWARGRGVEFQHLEITSATLEDVFLALTGKQLRD